MLRRLLSLVCLAGGFLWTAVPAHAQGCILCYTSTLAAGKGVQDALRNGVLVLLIPVAMIMIATALLVWRRAVATATS